MKKIIFLAIIASVLMSMQVWAQSAPPAGTPYISLTVTNNATIGIDMIANIEDTPVWIETANGNYIETSVGIDWTGFVNYTSNGTILKVYGNIDGFDCSNNDDKLTGLSFSNNLISLTSLFCYNNQLSELDVNALTNLVYFFCNNNNLTNLDLTGAVSLKYFHCYANNFNTQAIDNIYCTLSMRAASDYATICPANTSADVNHEEIIASNAQNARDKNWRVTYFDDDTDITTSGAYLCSSAVEDIKNAQFSIYPNPANELLNIKIAPQMLGTYITIYDQTGKKIISKKANAQTSTIGINDLLSGVYTIKIGSKTTKLVKN